MRNKSSVFKYFLPILLIMVVTSLTSCGKDTIQVGMIGSLTSKQSQLSIDARNAMEIAVTELNSNGGINGAMISLVVKDDGASHEVALQKHQEFLDEGVHLVIGHMTSNMTDAVLESEGPSLLFLSPSMSSEKLSTRDDFFLRTSPLTSHQGTEFIEFIKPMNLSHITVIYDLMNRDYTESLAETIEAFGLSNNLMTVDLIPFDSRENQLNSITEQIRFEETNCVLMISQATDTAFLAQKIKQIKSDILLSSVSWSMTQDLIHNGGAAVEDMYFIGVYHSEEASKKLRNFEMSFLDRFGYEPSFISVMAYDAMYTLAEGLKNADSHSPRDVKEGILALDYLEGLEETFEMNEYGDCNRRYLIYQLKSGHFSPLYE